MSEQVTNQINCLDVSLNAKLDELIAAVTDAASPDYTDLFNTIIASLQNLEANTDGIEASLTNIDTSTASALIELQNILVEVSAINENTDQVEELLQAIIDSLSAILNKEVFQFDSQADVCASVDGVATYVTPVVQYNTTTGAEVDVFYRDRLGVRITGVVVAADPCDCKCADCGSDELEDEAFDLTEFMSTQTDPNQPANTKVNLDDPSNTNAYFDVGFDGWTVADLVAQLNANAANAVGPTVPSNIDYSTTVFAVHPTIPTAMVVTSGPVPTTVDLVSIPLSLPVTSV